MSDVDASQMDNVLVRRGRTSKLKKYGFYPGQQLRGPSCCFQKVKWLTPKDGSKLQKNVCNNAPNESYCTIVEDVKVVSLDVKWICKPYSKENFCNQASEKPKYHVSGDDLKFIKMKNFFEPCTLQVGVRNYLKMKEGYEVISLQEWKNRMAKLLNLDSSSSSLKKGKVPKQNSFQSMEKVVTEALITETRADVVWQDGTIEHNVLSTSLYPVHYPVHHPHSNEFFPGDYVIDIGEDGCPYEYGVVKQVDHTGRTAKVTWMKAYHAGGNPHPEVLTEEEVSIYDIKYHPYFRYRPRDCVIRLDNSEDSCPSSTAGQVVFVHSTGRVDVFWMNGKTSTCYPQELYRIEKFNFEDLWANDQSLSDEDSCETELEKSLLGLDDGITEKDNDGASKDLERINDKNDGKTKEGVQKKLLANMEKLHAGIARFEEVFTQNPTLLTHNANKRLLELHKHCKVLDQLLGTTYFHERHLQSLVERLKKCGFVHLMTNLISHIFSTGKFNPNVTEDPIDPTLSESSEEDINMIIGSPVNNNSLNCKDADSQTSKDKDSMSLPSTSCNKEEAQQQKSKKFKFDDEVLSKVALLPPFSSNSKAVDQPYDICKEICAILKSSLLRAHEDASQRFGMPRSETFTLLDKQLDAVKQEKPPDEGVVFKENTEPVVAAVPEGARYFFTAGLGVFSMLESVPDNHKYKLSKFEPLDPCAFFRAVKKEMELLKSSLPEGIIVKVFEDRSDLYSVLIKGPKRTPYEDSLFFFDFQLPADYPKSPPLCHYISYCNDRLNPNLYEAGKVCVSLLGTWAGKGTEIWNPASSNLLQVIVSIQGLILVAEPYYNEPGFEREEGTQLGWKSSQKYNEIVVLKCVQSMAKLLGSPPAVFKDEIRDHFKSQFPKLVQRLEKWLEISESWNSTHPTSPVTPTSFKELQSLPVAQDVYLPEFPLIPASNGFCISLRKYLEDFKRNSASFLS